MIFLETERLVLRQLSAADLDDLVELDSDPEVMHYINCGKPTSREAMQNQFLPGWLGYYARHPGFGFWAAIEKSTGAFLGWFHFQPTDARTVDEAELGYRFRKAAWNKGYATEGSRALIRKGFTELGVRRVVAGAAIDNMGSRRVMEKAGLSLVGTVWKSRPELDGQRLPGVEYALDKAEWERQEANEV